MSLPIYHLLGHLKAFLLEGRNYKIILKQLLFIILLLLYRLIIEHSLKNEKPFHVTIVSLLMLSAQGKI